MLSILLTIAVVVSFAFIIAVLSILLVLIAQGILGP